MKEELIAIYNDVCELEEMLEIEGMSAAIEKVKTIKGYLESQIKEA